MNNKKIYVACTIKSTTGGPESLHQLVSKLNDMGAEAYIYYFNAQCKSGNIKINDKFKNYNIKFVTELEDNKDNILIVPEYYTYILYKYKEIKKYIWWLSLDFYFEGLPHGQVEAIRKRNNISKRLKILLYPYVFLNKKAHFKNFTFGNDKNDIFHLFNCEYVKEYLLKNGINKNNMEYLCGPIRDEYFKKIELDKKENILMYNPAKGYEFTAKIIKKIEEENFDVTIIPIKGMKPKEIVDNLNKAKVYMDFGFFPGPERIPREAVCRYCNILTSMNGSAKNNIDVPIPLEYKFEDIDENLDNIVKCIFNLMENFEDNIYKYEEYRNKVKEQKDLFNKNIYNIFIKN